MECESEVGARKTPEDAPRKQHDGTNTHPPTDVQELVVPPHLHLRSESGRRIRRDVDEVIRPIDVGPEGLVEIAVDRCRRRRRGQRARRFIEGGGGGGGVRRRRRRAKGDVLPGVYGRVGIDGLHCY